MASLSRVPIVYVNNFAGPHLGGGEVHLLHIVRGAVAAGMDVTVVAMPGSGTAAAAREAGVRVVEDDLMRGAPVGAAARLTGYLRDAHARIVHGTGFYTDVISRLAGPRAGALVVDQVHCEPAAPLTFTFGPRARATQVARSVAEAASRGRADAVIADSQALADALVAGGTDAARVTVVHNAVDAAALVAEAQAGERPQLPTDGLIVGTLGRLEAVKGHDVLLDAVQLLAGSVTDARFVVAGEGPEGGSLAARVAADPMLSGRVRLLGFVPSAPAFLSALDVYCLPSRSEGFNTTILEAMALGLPVVATDVGGTREAIEDGVTGRLVPSADPAALAAALSDLLRDRGLRSRLAGAGRLLVEREFTVEHMVEGTLAVYEGLLAAEEEVR